MSVDVNLFVDDAVQQLVGVEVAGSWRRFVVVDLWLECLQFLLRFW